MASRTVTRLAGTTAAVLVTAALTAVPLAGIASAAPAVDDQNCADFASRQEAQQHYDADPSDPDGLDDDNDREACEKYDYGSTGGGQDQPSTPGDPDDSDSGNQGGDDQVADRAADDQGGGTAQGSGTSGTGSSPGSDAQVGTTPVGSVDAGDGSALASGPDGQTDSPVIFLLGGFGALAASGAAAAVWSTRRSGISRR